MLRTALLCLAAVIALTAQCCKESSSRSLRVSRVEVGRVSWSWTRAADSAPSREEFEEAARAAVARLSPFPGGGGAPLVDLQGVYDQSEAEALVILTARMRKTGKPVKVETKVVATATLGEGFDSAALVGRGLADMVRALNSMFGIVGGDKEVWLRALHSAEPDEQILACRLVATNRVEEGVEDLAKLLSDPREQVAEEAAEALGEIGDERAVSLIIESIGRGDLRSEVRAIETMSKIGGEEARAYLEMTSIGHEVPEVRRVSADALERMKSL